MVAEHAVLMSVPGIEGSASLKGTDPGKDGSHEGWVPIESCSFSFTREQSAVDPDEDEDGGAEPATRVEPISIKRDADNSTAQLLMWLAGKEQKEEVLIDYCASSGRYYLRYHLKGVELVSDSISFTAPDDVSETLTLTYQHITVHQRPIDVTGEVLISDESTMEYTVKETE